MRWPRRWPLIVLIWSRGLHVKENLSWWRIWPWSIDDRAVQTRKSIEKEDRFYSKPVTRRYRFQMLSWNRMTTTLQMYLIRWVPVQLRIKYIQHHGKNVKQHTTHTNKVFKVIKYPVIACKTDSDGQAFFFLQCREFRQLEKTTDRGADLKLTCKGFSKATWTN